MSLPCYHNRCVKYKFNLIFNFRARNDYPNILNSWIILSVKVIKFFHLGMTEYIVLEPVN